MIPKDRIDNQQFGKGFRTGIKDKKARGWYFLRIPFYEYAIKMGLAAYIGDLSPY